MSRGASFRSRLRLACAGACLCACGWGLPAGLGASAAAGAGADAPASPAAAPLPAPSATRSGPPFGGARPPAAEAAADPESVGGFLRALIDAGRGDPEFLPPDAAFRVEGSAPSPDRVVLRWRIEPGYYLYAERMEVRLPEGASPGTTIAGLDLPPGAVQEDPWFGRVEIYRLEATASVRLAHAGAPPEAVTLDVVYQGCADEGLCYPPVRKALPVRLDGARIDGTGTGPGAPAGAPETSAPPPAPLSETDRIARRLATDGLGVSVLAFFGFGLLLALTPCILPMAPILSSILVAGGAAARGRGRGLALSLAYVSGSALAWAGVGGIAGLLGANVQIALQSPWALGTVSAAFVALALSMFGLYSFELPAAWTTRASGWTNRAGRGGGYAGAAAMGVVSALVVGPCVAAPMAGAVLYIGQAGDAARGSLALFAMGFGMGAPLLLLGASSPRLLPRAGPWMDALQRAAGVVLLGVAAYLLGRVLPPPAALAAWAVVAVSGAAVLAWAARRRLAGAPGRRAAAAGALAAAAYAAVLAVGASTGGRDPLHPLAGLLRSPAGPGGAAVGPGGIEFTAVKGLDGPNGLDAALVRAEAAGRFVMLDFYADWCVSCKEMEETTFRDPRVRSALGGVRVLRADVTANDAADQALMKRLGVLGPPAILFFGPDRAERRSYRTVGYKDATDFMERVSGATSAA